MDYNKAIISGRLTRDPELRQLPSGQHVCDFTVATNRVWTDKQGQRQQDTQFHNLVVFGKDAEILCEHTRKGTTVLVDGRLQTRSWEQDGVKHCRTEIVVDSFRLGPKSTKSVSEEAETPLVSAEEEEAATPAAPF